MGKDTETTLSQALSSPLPLCYMYRVSEQKERLKVLSENSLHFKVFPSFLMLFRGQSPVCNLHSKNHDLSLAETIAHWCNTALESSSLGSERPFCNLP